jgi:hypothetical protein
MEMDAMTCWILHVSITWYCHVPFICLSEIQLLEFEPCVRVVVSRGNQFG